MIQLGSIDREAIAFQEELDRVQVEPVPVLLRLWPFLAAALLAGLVGLAAFLRVDVVVTAPGQAGCGRTAPDAAPGRQHPA
ncbi:hypothetical protein ACTTAM_07880 [Rhodobacter capsulatus]|uniref:hypothetical protein n=1 Tax=Rhodobacter capsulatus TaxID=1061 RepID=UPI004029F597